MHLILTDPQVNFFSKNTHYNMAVFVIRYKERSRTCLALVSILYLQTLNLSVSYPGKPCSLPSCCTKPWQRTIHFDFWCFESITVQTRILFVFFYQIFHCPKRHLLTSSSKHKVLINWNFVNFTNERLKNQPQQVWFI